MEEDKRIRAGARVEEARQALSMSQQELAEKAGISRGYLANIEAGRKGIPRKLFQFLSEAGFSIEWLMFGTEPRKKIKASSKPKAEAPFQESDALSSIPGFALENGQAFPPHFTFDSRIHILSKQIEGLKEQMKEKDLQIKGLIRAITINMSSVKMEVLEQLNNERDQFQSDSTEGSEFFNQ